MGQYQKKLYTQLNTTYPNFVSDFNKEYSKQKIALQLVELRLETGLSQSRYAEENQLLQNQTYEYIAYLKKLIEVAQIMKKEFYIVVPFDLEENKSVKDN